MPAAVLTSAMIRIRLLWPAFRQEIRINCFSSGSKTFVKVPDIRNWEERDRFYGERQDVKMDAFLTERFAEIAQKVDALILSEMQKLGFTPEQQ